MELFKLSKEELVTFAKKLYQEACNGYLDLCDTVAENMVSELLEDKSRAESILSTPPLTDNQYFTNVDWGETIRQQSDPAYNVGVTVTVQSPTTPSLFDSLPENFPVRREQVVRNENFVGNVSERM